MKKIILIVVAIFIASITYAQVEFWGATFVGGSNGGGSIFKTNDSGDNISNVRSFLNNASGDASSALPIMQASNGIIYGMTNRGGDNKRGTIYKYDIASSTYTKLVDFDKTNKGSEPFGYLIQASNGKLYGMTPKGGLHGSGVIFQYNITTNTFIKKFDFGTTNTGEHPMGSFLKATNGKLYGMNREGGLNNKGIIFEYDPATNIFTKKYDFTDIGGRRPNGTMMQALNGKIYGMTYSGGTNNDGVIFEYDPVTNVYTKKINFDEITKGEHPADALLQASNGKLYGMTSEGGMYGKGVLFEYDIATNTFTKKVDFDGSSKGKYPVGKLMQAPNGKLYGLTSQGGANDTGVLFEFDPTTDIFTKKINLSNMYAYPSGHLIIIGQTSSINSITDNTSMMLFPNPNNGRFTLEINSKNTKPEVYYLEVYSPIGALIHNAKLELASSLSKQMNFENLSKGVYFIRLRSKNDVLNARFIIQ